MCWVIASLDPTYAELEKRAGLEPAHGRFAGGGFVAGLLIGGAVGYVVGAGWWL